MSASAINSLLENHMGSLGNHKFSLATTKSPVATIFKSPIDSVINRKHYSDSSGSRHVYESREPPAHSYGGHGSEKKGRSIALTALTLLSFLFFLHILQQCLQDQMDDMNPQVIIMQARIKAVREAEAKEASKEAEKRIGDAPETTTKTATKNDKEQVVTPFKKSENEYQYEKVQIPVKIRSKGSRWS